MPNIGEFIRGNKLGYRNKRQYIWIACPDCKKERWVIIDKRRLNQGLCVRCALKRRHWIGSNHPSWKGGRKTYNGYVFILLPADDFFRPMADSAGYVREHRLVMAKYLGRNLQSWEIVHHKNQDRTDNRLENLQLVTDDRHKQITVLERKIDKLIEKQDLLMVEVKLLRLENRQLKDLCNIR